MRSLRVSKVSLYKLDHLGHGLGGKNGQVVRNEQELVGLASLRVSRLESAKSDALAVIGAASASVNERRVEPVHIEVVFVNEEALSDGGVAVSIRVNVEPKEKVCQVY
jgi:hypothetical protein